MVERQVKHGADWIKVMATGGIRTPGTDPGRSQFTGPELQAVVALASAHGRPVAAHAHGAGGIADAVRAGCRTIEHCSWIGPGWRWGCVDEAVVEEMARRRICVAPTAHANWARQPMGGSNYARMSAALTQLRQAGVQLLASSDAGAIPGLSHDALAGGVEVLASMAGMPAAEALRAATSRCAEAIGLGAECGRLARGLGADLLVVRGDPTSDLAALRRPPRLVVARGRRVPGVASNGSSSAAATTRWPSPPSAPASWEAWRRRRSRQ